MSDQVWYLYQNGQQVGPFDTQQVVQLSSNKMIAQDAYIFKVGWKDWRPIEEAYEDLNLKPPTTPTSEASIASRRSNAPRATIMGRIVIHNNGQLAIGNGVNISSSGIFVETDKQIFTIGEMLKVSVRCNGLAKPFNAIARVIRFNNDPRFPVGYGLRFEDLDQSVQQDVEGLVQRMNKATQVKGA